MATGRKKYTYRDIKPGAKFLIMAGYGSDRVLSAWEITEKVTVKGVDGKIRDADSGFWAKRTWFEPPYTAYAEREWFEKKDVPYFIKTGLFVFGRKFDTETGLLEWVAPSVEEQEKADKEKAAYERFTKSETYRSM